jgi:hypothetical protein
MLRAGNGSLANTGKRPREADLRRMVSAAAVLAVHFGILAAFLFAHGARTFVSSRGEEIEIRFPPPPPRPALSIAPALKPQWIAPVAPMRPALPGQLFAPEALPAPGANSLSGVGRALFGCDPQKLDLLSAQDRAACVRAPAKPPQQSVGLGRPPDPNSSFAKEIEERFREARPINRPCELGSFNDTHGLPCFGFGEQAPLLPHR